MLGSEDTGIGSVPTAADATTAGPPGPPGPPATLGTGIPGPTALGSAGVAVTARKSDQTAPAYRSDLPLSATFFIDPVNGSDAVGNPGTSAATALKTLHGANGLKQRWWSAELTVNTTVTVLGNIPATDIGAWNFTVKPGVTVTFIGTLGATTGFGGAAIDNTLYTGSVTGFVAASLTQAADDIELTDAAIPVSYTASGLMVPGVIFRRTVTATRHWFAAKDLGAKTIRISAPMLNAAVDMNSSLAVGNAYSAFQLWTWPDQDFGAVAPYITLDSLYEVCVQSQSINPGYEVIRRRIWRGGTSTSLAIGLCTNTITATATGTIIKGVGRTPTHWIGGGFLGDGTTVYQLFGVLGISKGTISQGCQLSANDYCYLSLTGTMAWFDCTVPTLVSQANSRITWVSTTANTGMSGKGNTGKLLSISMGGACYYNFNGAVPPFVAAVTTDANPITIGTQNYTVAALPAVTNVLLTCNTIFPLAQNFTSPANAAAAVVMTNAPAGSPGVPARYVAWPDGAGGTITVPSLT